MRFVKDFKLLSEYSPTGDQAAAVEALCRGVKNQESHLTLMGVTGSGKTFTVANVIEKINRPVLVISHNKTLAAQLYQEFKRFFPENAVEYFVSYYDYYQPEAFMPSTNTYISKEVTINSEIDRMRLKASNSLFQRRDVIVVASVSCIYGIGSPATYYSQSFSVNKGQNITRKNFLKKLVNIQYTRQDENFQRGTFRVRGDIVELFSAYEDFGYRFSFEDNRIQKINLFDPLLGRTLDSFEKIIVYPRTFFTTPKDILNETISKVENELNGHVAYLKKEEKHIEADRLEERTLYDLEMLQEFGWCPGIENYSLYLSRRIPGQPPYTLLDYFPDDFLTIIDESHVTVPQIGGMYHGDRSRKQTLIEHGFRLPSALDNRPLNFEEFEKKVNQVLYVSATPGSYELKKTSKRIVEQIIRPTGLADPEIEIRPVKGQVDDLMVEIENRALAGQRTLVTTLTKKMAENLTRHYHEQGIKVRYLHSDIETLDRVKILKDLRKGKFDALIGINLLREGLDLPEVSLVAILDADKEGFLRSETSLIQTFGRASRHIHGKAILYADRITTSMKRAMDETSRRRQIQLAYNTEFHITPRSIHKRIEETPISVYDRDYYDVSSISEEQVKYLSTKKRIQRMNELEQMMKAAVKNLEFEKAAQYRDELKRIKKWELELGD